MRLKQNNAAILWRNLMGMVVGLTVLMGLVTILAIGNQLLKTSATDSTAIVSSLKKSVIASDSDWRDWRRDSTLNTSNSYVKVINMRTDATTKTYYSPGTRALLKTAPTAVPLIANLYYQPQHGFFYFATGHARGIKYQLWVSVSAQVAILWRVLAVMVVVMVLMLLISPLYLRLLTNRLTTPLTTLSEAVQAGMAQPHQSQVQLPVPTRPTEVHQLAIDFNQLLAQIHDQTLQEQAFVMNAAHELKTPIATIRSHAQLIQRRGAAHPEIIPKSIGFINDESHQMQALVEELLMLARVDQAELTTQPIDMTPVVTQLVTELTPVIAQTIQVALPDELPVVADQASVIQILTTLVTNAGKYIPKTATITISAAVRATTVDLRVSDTGAGIAADEQPHIFDRFYRGAAVRGTIAGTGLGLAIAQQLALLNQGALVYAPVSPHGSCFTLTLPKK
ncbi:sensor histidine kinase [Lactiplantibacillus fabifermentans]|uniref:histidine kinase n=2 Tax=Lactiplantibacillus fabifermentans TaxID=483011 RepID=A0A0R2NJG1_9LACO|nr:HAMP domain-containing sensor histidine kinase [Lactiplantibacillus fabifermentans]ETY75006.1 signal transduction histidine kinase [Lactiplantibacillus fabifermentans T30PCM01]KRO25913.1 signal transduction histidine kinase [Lactiplantibacillus fabifermentans DSM 21115]